MFFLVTLWAIYLIVIENARCLILDLIDHILHEMLFLRSHQEII